MHDKMMIDFRAMSKFQLLLNGEPLSTQIKLRHVKNCYKSPLYTQGTNVPILLSRFKGGERRAHFSGLMTCKNAWSCPHCAAMRVIEYRERVTQVIENFSRRDWCGIMVTLTIPHYIYDSAKWVLDTLTAARRTFNNGGFATFMKSVIGERYWSFTATECKYSTFNGWHFHQHVLYLIPASKFNYFQRDDVKTKLENYWKHAVELNAGREVRWSDKEAGVALYVSPEKVVNGNYIAKEMCKGDNGAHRSCTPLELLKSNDPADNELYVEFALATIDHHRFRGSQGLWKFTDVEAVKKTVAERNEFIETVVVGSFTFDGWNEIIEREFEDNEPHRLNILRRVELDGGSGALEYCYEKLLPIPELHGRYRRSSGDSINNSGADVQISA